MQRPLFLSSATAVETTGIVEGADGSYQKGRMVNTMPKMTRLEIVKEIERLEEERDSWTNFSKNGRVDDNYIAYTKRLNDLYAMLPDPQ